MDLSFRKLGSGEPLIILHGLFGSGDNWYSIAREFTDTFTVYLVDQRNHGNSPHHPEHNYTVMAADLYQFMQRHNINNAYILGHSMGGKAALAFGLKHPEKVKKMVVIDISPLGYSKDDPSISNSDQMTIIRSLLTIATEQLTGREEADNILKKAISSAMVRQFLLKSLKRTKDGKFQWALNLQALHDNMPSIFEGIVTEGETDPRGIPGFPLLFIKGERSDYMRDQDMSAIRHYFPAAEIKIISGVGHWMHAEQPEVFVKMVREFLEMVTG